MFECVFKFLSNFLASVFELGPILKIPENSNEDDGD